MSEAALEAAILDVLAARDPGKTICPSDAARAAAAGGPEWRELMGPVRATARRLVIEGRLEVTQSGRVVDLDRARGAIRLRLPDVPPT